MSHFRLDDGAERSPRIEMSEGELQTIADFTEVPLVKVRGIVWLAEWRAREQERSRFEASVRLAEATK